MLVCTSMYWFILVHTSTYYYILLTGECVYLYIPAYPVTYQYILVHTGTYQYIPVGTHTYQFILVHTGTYMYIPVYNSTYLYTLVCTGMYFHHKVNSEIIVKQVFVVCTAIRLCFQDHQKGMFLWSRVLLARLPVPEAKKISAMMLKRFTPSDLLLYKIASEHRYIPVHTSTYQYVLRVIYTRMYQYILVCTGIY